MAFRKIVLFGLALMVMGAPLWWPFLCIGIAYGLVAALDASNYVLLAIWLALTFAGYRFVWARPGEWKRLAFIGSLITDEDLNLDR